MSQSVDALYETPIELEQFLRNILFAKYCFYKPGKRMYILGALLMALLSANFINGRIINSQNLEPQKVDEDGTILEENSTVIEEYEELKEYLLRILTSTISRELRYKRSAQGYSPGFQWHQAESTNSWRSGSYQNPYFISIDGYDHSGSQYKNKYTHSKNEKKPSSTTGGSPPDQFKMAAGPHHQRQRDDDEKPTWNMAPKKNDAGHPIWALRAYNVKGKGSRFSRASSSGTTPNHSQSRKNNEVMEEQAFADKGYMSNEVPSITFKQPKSERPGRCTWAILSCCSSSTDDFNRDCFLSLGCEKKFLGSNLCRPDYIQIAMDVAHGFYDEKESSKK